MPLKVHRIEPVYMNAYYQAWQDINRHYQRRARKQELKTIKKLRNEHNLQDNEEIDLRI